MVSDNRRIRQQNQAAAHPREGRSHPGSPSFARQSPRSRDNRAALTRCPIGGEVGADCCLLGMKRIQKSVKNLIYFLTRRRLLLSCHVNCSILDFQHNQPPAQSGALPVLPLLASELAGSDAAPH